MTEGTWVSVLVSDDVLPPEAMTRRVGLAPTTPTARRWKLTVAGPTTLDAPHVPAALARTLLGQLGDKGEALAALSATVVLEMRLPRLLTFGFALPPDVTAALAKVGRLAFVLREEGVQARLRAFDTLGPRPDGDEDRCTVSLTLAGDALDPAAVTTALGLAPTRASTGHWRHEVDGTAACNGARTARALLARLPPPEAWVDIRGDSDLSVRFAFTGSGLTGVFELDADLAAAIATLGARLELWFGNVDA